jgi:hypothetical protein
MLRTGLRRTAQRQTEMFQTLLRWTLHLVWPCERVDVTEKFP